MRLIGVLVSFFMGLGLCAQDMDTIRGLVYDKDGNPYIGVQVEAKISEGVARALTDVSGRFFLITPKINSDSLTVTLSYNGANFKKRVVPKSSIHDLVFIYSTAELEVVEVFGQQESGLIKMPVPDITIQPITRFEDIIKASIGVSSSNELTQNYNVRGGNFDENLIYVNGVEIYRPFLGRSGQQEGLSFIHSFLVEDIYFSAGGFSVKYQDKLSSVLDVQYKRPEKGYSGLFNASLLGAEAAVLGKPNDKFDFLIGARYRTNAYLFGGLEVKGSYRPVFYDAQTLLNFYPSKKTHIQVLGHFASNNYRVVPQTSEVEFGTINQALQFNVYYEGQEETRYMTGTGAVTFNYFPSSDWQHAFTLSAYGTNEAETFDILGEYFLNNLDTQAGSETLGDSTSNLGIGAYLEHARNFMIASVYSANYKGEYSQYGHKNFMRLRWGTTYKHEIINSYLSEWQYLDSAGYSVPQAPSDEILLNEVIKANHFLVNDRISAYVENSWDFELPSKKLVTYSVKDSTNKRKVDTTMNVLRNFGLTAGVRGGYWTYNKEFWGTPRVAFNFIPAWYTMDEGILKRRNINFSLSVGMFYQPPFYRELLMLNGTLNPEVLAQKSVHIIGGVNYSFKLGGKPFKFIGEAYYKQMWDVNPYKIENTNINYFANNNAVAYATGIDLLLNGEFIPGVQSWLKLGLLKTMENVLNDYYYEYRDADGNVVYPGSPDIADTSTVFPGNLPRPSDQRLTVGVTFEDEMPRFEAMKLKLGLTYITGFPHGPPSNVRYTDTLRSKDYLLVNVGFGFDFLAVEGKKKGVAWKEKNFFKPFNKFYLSLEVFNLFNFKNVISYDWITSISGAQYAVPNYLTSTRINLKLVVGFKNYIPKSQRGLQEGVVNK